MNLEKTLDKMLKDKNYDFSNMKIKYIKEDDSLYVIYFEELIRSVGNQLIYKIDKKTGDYDDVFLPNDDNFELLNRFESCDFVQIPEKYKNKYF